MSGEQHPPDVAGWIGVVMVVLGFVAFLGFATLAIQTWSGRFSDEVDPPVARVAPDGRAELVLRQDRAGQYTAPGTINGVGVEFLLDTGASGVAVPPALADRLGLYRYQRVEIVTAAAIVPGWLVRLDRVTLGPLERRRVRGSVSEQFIGDQVLLGMSFLAPLRDRSARAHAHVARARVALMFAASAAMPASRSRLSEASAPSPRASGR